MNKTIVALGFALLTGTLERQQMLERRKEAQERAEEKKTEETLLKRFF